MRDGGSVPLVVTGGGGEAEAGAGDAQSAGRGVASVFPSQAKASHADAAVALRESILGMDGRAFVTEDELKELKAKVGERVEDGTKSDNGRTLAEAMRMAKEAKDAQYAEVGRIMKQGGNKPLEEDEVDFLNAEIDDERAREASARRRDDVEVRQFRALRQLQEIEARAAPLAAAAAATAAADGSGGAGDKGGGAPLRAPPALAPRVRVVKRKAPPAQAQAQAQPQPPPPSSALGGLAAYASDSD